MDFRQIIAKRRDGLGNSAGELEFLAKGAASGEIPDYQLSAWLMATIFRPLDPDETAELTRAMADSGARLDLSGIPGPHLDKHSTGGVGDKTTIVLLPMLAASGICMIKMSGAGLGITGGTTDKLSSIPGFRLDLTPKELLEQAARIGIALSSQTGDLAPADKVFYSLRDATETTASQGLIVSSILSKKLAGGAESVVIDVKCGSGGFMKDLEQATALKKALVETGRRCGLNVVAEITDMSEPLGSAVGNGLEVREAIHVLQGQILNESSNRFRALCVQLAATALLTSGRTNNLEAASELALHSLNSGSAAKKAEEWFAGQGAKGSLDEILEQIEAASSEVSVKADRTGFIASIDAHSVGEIVVTLGGGRKSKGDRIDPRVGVTLEKPVGGRLEIGEVVGTIHASDIEAGERAARGLAGAIRISETEISQKPIVLG